MALRFPTFVVIGAAKSGSTSLYYYLKQHPQIFMSPVKEPRFVALEGHALDFRGPGDKRVRETTVTTLEGYQRLFDGVRDERAAGEASVLYLHHPDAAVSIARYVPDVKLIALLRDPSERAYSAFLYHTRDGHEPLATFEEALDDEARRLAAGWYHGWGYRDFGFYHRHLSRYFGRFDADRIRVYLTEDLDRAPHQLVEVGARRSIRTAQSRWTKPAEHLPCGYIAKSTDRDRFVLVANCSSSRRGAIMP